MGVSHFLVRDPVTGRFKRISDDDEIERAIDEGLEHYRIYTKDPNVQAFTDLMNRALDKPAKQVADRAEHECAYSRGRYGPKLQEALIREERLSESRNRKSDLY